MSVFRRLFVFVCLLFSVAVVAQLPSIHPTLSFEPNKGQADPSVRFLARSMNNTIFLTDNRVVLNANSHHGSSISLTMTGASISAPVGELPTGGMANYYLSNKRDNWRDHLPLYAAVRYPSVYPGVDVVLHQHEDQLELDFEVAPGSSAAGIQLTVDNADQIFVEDGVLNIAAGNDVWKLLPPVAYQNRDGGRVSVKAGYRLVGKNRIAVTTDEFDPSSKLIIDPVVEYSKNVSLSNDTTVTAMNVDADGNLVMTGRTFAFDYPVVGGLPPSPSGSEQVFVTKFDSQDGSIIYSTYLPASNFNAVNGLALDAQRNAYLSIGAGGDDFPQTTNLGVCTGSCSGGGYVTKLASDGSIVYSTLIGQVGPAGIAVDTDGNAYVAGSATFNGAIQTVNAYQPVYVGSSCTSCGESFFAKLNPTGTNFVFSSYFSGAPQISGEMFATTIGLDGQGNIFFAGSLFGADPPLVNQWQSGAGEFFLAKFAPDGKTLLFSSAFGGSTPSENSSRLAGLKIGSDGTIYLSGYTGSHDFPYTVNAPLHPVLPDDNFNSTISMFAMAVDPSLTHLKYCTYLGDGFLTAMNLDAQNNLYVAGQRGGTYDISLKNPVVSDISNGGIFLSLDSSGNLLNISQFGGHASAQIPNAIAVDSSHNVYLSGGFSPANSTSPFTPDPVMVGPQNVTNIEFAFGFFLAKVNSTNGPKLSVTSSVITGSDLPAPFLLLRNLGSATLNLTSISLSGGLSQKITNCGASIPAGASCYLTLADANGGIAAGTLTITSNDPTPTKSFNITLPQNTVSGTPIGDWPIFSDTKFVFPPQFTGTTSASIPLKIWNLGTEASKIDSVLNFGNVMQTNDCGALAPGASCTVQVSVTPNGQTANQLAINYDTNINDSNHSGTGGLEQNYFIFAPESQQQLLLSTKGIAFGHQNVGGNGLVRAVTVTNTGSSSASAPAVSIQGAADFTVAANTCTATLQAHQSCVVGVKFVPSGNGVRTGTLSIVNGSTASLFGIAEINSAVKVAPLDLDFFTIVIGHTFSNDVVLTNTTNSAIGISNISISQPEFTQTNDCAGSIPASGSCTVHISFTPQHAVTKNASMTITFAGNVAAQVINMTGTGATPFDVTPTSIDFGNDTLVGGTSDMQFVSMGNGRGAFSQAYTLSLTGDFVIAQNPCANPLPGFVGCALQIEFKPTHPGSQQGALTISYPGISDQTVVTFTGSTAPSFVAQPSAGSSFSATVSPGSTATYNLTYNAAAAFSGTVQLSCSGIPAHAACNLQPASLDLTTARSGSVTVKISTTSQTASLRNHHPILLFAAIFCMPFLLGTFVHKRKAILGSVALLMILAVGCGGGSGGGTNPPPPPSNTTPVGTYTIFVTATGGGDTETTPLTLTVHN